MTSASLANQYYRKYSINLTTAMTSATRPRLLLRSESGIDCASSSLVPVNDPATSAYFPFRLRGTVLRLGSQAARCSTMNNIADMTMVTWDAGIASPASDSRPRLGPGCTCACRLRKRDLITLIDITARQRSDASIAPGRRVPGTRLGSAMCLKGLSSATPSACVSTSNSSTRRAAMISGRNASTSL